MTARATGIGSMPGTDVVEAVRVVLGELGDPPGLPHLPELPERGAGATTVGRTVALVDDLGFDLQPAGWRLTGGAPGLDQRRARSLLGQDLDAFFKNGGGGRGRYEPQELQQTPGQSALNSGTAVTHVHECLLLNYVILLTACTVCQWTYAICSYIQTNSVTSESFLPDVSLVD